MVLTRYEPRPILVGGEPESSPDRLVVRNPASPDEPAGETYEATADQLERATVAAVDAFEATRRLGSWERGAILREISSGVSAAREELARLITLEVAKPIRDSFVEVDRTALAFRLAAEEAERITGELIPLDLLPASRGRVGITRRFPIGPVAAISPFNLPLGLAVHKLAPAIAAGNSIVLKPPSKAPLALLRLGEIMLQSGLPAGALSILPMRRDLGDRLVSDERFKLLTFTGSPSVGWDLKQRAGKKKVVLELGGNAAAIIDRSADLDWAASRCVIGAYKFAGQLCVSIQRLLVHEDVWPAFLERFRTRIAGLTVGDPLDPATELAPLIDKASAERVGSWIDEAVALGGRVVLGGEFRGAWLEPTILMDVPPQARLCTQEAFAPLVVASTFRDFDEVLARVNDSAFGLQAGVFTNDLGHAWSAFAEIEVGGVIINDIPSYRIDNMPFGGVKDSGLGREGIRWAIEDMTELRLMVMATPG